MLPVIFTVLVQFISVATDLANTAELARQQEQPIVLYISRSDCTFCRALERDVLGPLIKSELFSGRVQFRELGMDSGADIRDFNEKRVLPGSVAARYNVVVTPTILFLNAGQQEIVHRLVGYNGNEFFSYYLEKRIEEARFRAVSAVEVVP